MEHELGDYDRWYHLEYHQGLRVAHQRRHAAWEGPGKTRADAGMGSCMDIPEHHYILCSRSMGQSWNFTQWRQGGRSIYNEGSHYREPTHISDLERRSRGGNPEWWHPVSTGEDESTEFRFDGRRVSVDGAESIANIVREHASPATLLVLVTLAEHKGNARKAARYLGVPESTFHDAKWRARREARGIISSLCPSPDTGS